MKKKNKVLLIFTALCLTVLVPSLADDYYDKPSRNEVVLVFSCRMQPEPDLSFFSQYANIPGKFIKLYAEGDEFKAGFSDFLSGSKSFEVDTKRNSVGIHFIYPSDPERIYTVEKFSKEAIVTTEPLDIPDDRRIRLVAFEYRIASCIWFYVILPLGVDIVIPKNVNYIYLGDFVYQTEGLLFLPKGVKRGDSFDDAEKIVKLRYGAKAELARIALQEPKIEKKE